MTKYEFDDLACIDDDFACRDDDFACIDDDWACIDDDDAVCLSLIHISEPTRH